MTGQAIERVLANGTIACREKLYWTENRKKPDTRTDNFDNLFVLLKAEVEELHFEMRSHEQHKHGGLCREKMSILKEMRLEAADVANFAMAIIDKCDEYLEG